MGQHQEEFLIALLVALSLGIVAGWAFPALPFSILLVVMSVLFVWAVFSIYRSSKQVWPAFLMLIFVLGVLRIQAGIMLPENDISHFAGKQLHITGVLKEAPQIRERSDGSISVRYCLKAEQVRQGKESAEPVNGGLYIYARSDKGKLESLPKIGDTLTASGTVRLPHAIHNPGQIDTELLLRSQGITATLLAGKGGVNVTQSLEDRETAVWVHVLRKLAEVREHYLSSMRAVMPKEDAAAIFAMLFGGYQGLNPELLEAFTTTGIVHILSVSGSHISLLAAVMAWLGAFFRLPKVVRVVLVIAAIAVYSMLAGLVPPVLRSALMGGLTFMALALDREKDARRLLILTGLLMLTVSPILLYHISFQLSFAATAGLLYVAPPVRDWLQSRRVPAFVAAGMAITFAAHASTLPILAWYFNQLSLSAFLANIVIVPIVEVIIIIGIMAGLLAFAVPLVGRIACAGDSILLGLVYELARWMAAMPGSMIWIPSLEWPLVVFYYSVLALLVLKTPWRQQVIAWLKEKRQYIVVMSVVFIAFSVGYKLSQNGKVTLSAIDCQQGDALMLRTVHGKVVLFDCGGERNGNEPGAFNTGERIIVPYLRHYGVHEVEAIFLTHAHADHAGGAGAVLKNMPVGRVYTADEGRDAYAQSMGLGSADRLLAKLHPAREGEVFDLDGVRIEVIYAPEITAKGQDMGNEASNVYRISYGQASFLITGDLTKENEQVILAQGKNIHSTVLKVGHHGSDTSSSEEFLQAVAPRYAVISVGAGNSFGHPKQEVLNRLQKMDIRVFRTDQNGEIKFCTDGKTMRVDKYIE
ncbi:DNA internalization-related competence protein ComEC/Rec2 [Selenomonas ruminantium]|uniref:DNA internalization-related competence protein ComEC/Rec2 n=1 Tax=Selenomonas ruminantium TaxID=971 RepID=UPI0026F0BE6F|nr:DNA internalization-related competence protein ComEC/Rec2 [Selenomonas ruminantium]